MFDFVISVSVFLNNALKNTRNAFTKTTIWLPTFIARADFDGEKWKLSAKFAPIENKLMKTMANIMRNTQFTSKFVVLGYSVDCSCSRNCKQQLATWLLPLRKSTFFVSRKLESGHTKNGWNLSYCLLQSNLFNKSHTENFKYSHGCHVDYPRNIKICMLSSSNSKNIQGVLKV